MFDGRIISPIKYIIDLFGWLPWLFGTPTAMQDGLFLSKKFFFTNKITENSVKKYYGDSHIIVLLILHDMTSEDDFYIRSLHKEQQNLTPSLILASASPRRQHLLAAAGVAFEIVPSRIREDEYPFTDPISYAKMLAEAKSQDVSRLFPESWIIGADSIVEIDDEILEKPNSISEARLMMQLLSGRTHYVHTGYSIICKVKNHLFSDVVSTAVKFKDLTETEIEWYIHTPEPYDKAGGYAIQGLGSFMVKYICGSYTNVVGLPVCEVVDHLFKQGVISRNQRPFHHVPTPS